jgi:hypothetical protein
MANITRTITYRCSDDCIQSGCPTHIATLQYQSTVDHYTFDLNGQVIALERGKMDALITLLKSLDRVDCARVEQQRNNSGE